MTKIGFIGAGNMAFALGNAISQKGLAKAIYVYDISKERVELFKKEFKAEIKKSNKDVAKDSDVVFLAVKPQVIDSVLDEIDESDKLVISIAAGVKLARIEAKLKKARVVRVMPNTPCLVGEMAAGFAVGKKVSDDDTLLVEKILNSAGNAFLLKEELLDAVTGLSGSGPAFVARLMEYFIEAGKKQGLSEDVAADLAIQTFKGTAKLLEETKMSPDELVNMVSSPGGTTVAGRKILEKSDVKDVLIKTVEEATKRSRELANER